MSDTRFKETIKIIFTNQTGRHSWIRVLAVFIAIVAFILGALWIDHIALLGFVIAFTYFDLVGYEGLPAEEKAKYPNPSFVVQSYRVDQGMFQASLIPIMMMGFDVFMVIRFLLLHFTGVNDLLYRIIGSYPMPMDEVITWKRWTILGWFKHPLKRWQCVIQAIVGIAIVVATLII